MIKNTSKKNKNKEIKINDQRREIQEIYVLIWMD